MIKRRRKFVLYFIFITLTIGAFLQFGFLNNVHDFLSGTQKSSASTIQTSSAELKSEIPVEITSAELKSEIPVEITTATPRPISYPTLKYHRNYERSLMTNRSCMERYDLLILVSSAPANLERRNNIRKTWAFDRVFKPKWTTVFLVAQTVDQTLSNSLLKEDEEYGDLVRANYYDHYWNQTRKIQMGFEWAVTYCNFSFLLKTDDDVFVNIPDVLSFLREPATPKKQLYVGNHYTNPLVYRGGKWKVTIEEYSEPHYPDFCPGFGYILSYDVVVLFFKAFPIVPYFRLDDVYVGMLANKTSIKIIHNEGFEVWQPPGWYCNPKTSTLVRHDVEGHCLLQMFNKVSSNITQ